MEEWGVSLVYRCKTPGFTDALVFYGADVVSTSLEGSLKRELRKKNPDGWVVLFQILGIAGSEVVKAGVNSQVNPPFTSMRDTENERETRKRVN
jgi:hypothetical protein